MLVALSVVVALILSLVSNNGLNIIKTQVDELILANNIERNTYRAILEEKNYLLNANCSVVNRDLAKQAFLKADAALKSIYLTLDELETGDEHVLEHIRSTREAISGYEALHKRGVYLLEELGKQREILQEEGENITLHIQEYVEAKRIEVKAKLSQKTMEKINTGSNIWQYTYMTRADEKRYLLSPDKAIFEAFEKDHGFMMSELKRLKKMSDQPFELEKIKRFHRSAKHHEKAMRSWVKHNKELVETVLPKTKVLGSLAIDKTLKIADLTVENIEKKRELVTTTLIIFTLLAILFGVLFGGSISRSISSIILNFQTGLLDFFKYLDRQKNSANQIAIESKDEIAVMAEIVNENIVKVEDVMEKKLFQMKEDDEQMLKQSRLAQMGEMISMIAHQWRQPLGAISATISDMEVKLFQRRKYDLTTSQGREDMEKYTLEGLHVVKGFVKHLSSTIDDFRNFFKSNKAKSSFSLTSLMDRALNLSEHLIGSHGIEVVKRYDADLGRLESFESEILQVLLSLIHNAVDALVEKGIEHPRILVSIGRNRKGSQVVSVEDNAGGVPEGIIDKIFDPYFSTKDQSGTGLGLYMSQMIIEQHCHGRISAKNTNDGACLMIEFIDEERY